MCFCDNFLNCYVTDSRIWDTWMGFVMACYANIFKSMNISRTYFAAELSTNSTI